jgi:hypothetical protein
MINIFAYHWIWYLIGFVFAPKLTIMIWISIYFRNALPLPLLIIGWFNAICSTITFKVNKGY